MQDYRVELDAYSGPLDLLLYLVKRHEIDLYDIPVATLTDQYLEHLQLIEDFDINVAADFLVMAATLLEIKSQMLIPRAPDEDGEGDGTDALSELDPRYELVQQLLEYKRFKDAATELGERKDEWKARFTIKPTKVVDSSEEEKDDEVEIDIDDVHILDLCEAFARILESIGQTPYQHEVVYDDTPIGLHAEDIVDRLKRDGQDGSMTLQSIFVGRQSRGEMIGLFLATLELVKQRRVCVIQDKMVGEIRLKLMSEEERATDDQDAPDWRDPVTGEIQYEWPNEAIRQKVEQRAKRRSERLSKREFGDGGSDDIIDVDDIDEGEDGEAPEENIDEPAGESDQ